MKEVRKNWFEKIFVSDADLTVSDSRRNYFLILSPLVLIAGSYWIFTLGHFLPILLIPILIFSLSLKLYALKTLRVKYQAMPNTKERQANKGLKNMVIIYAYLVFWLLLLLAVNVTVI